MPPTEDLGFVHAFEPAAAGAGADAGGSDGVTLLLLHGTGGDERDLLPLGRQLWPAAALLGVRGRVLENGLPRFFRRFAEGVFDVDDLKARTHELAGFIEAAAGRYGFSTRQLIAVGYSNGANIAASLMLLHPESLAAGVLLRAMVPLRPEVVPDLSGLSAFIAGGARDPIVPRDQTAGLAALLQSGGADVSVFWHRGGHELGSDDVVAAQSWLAGLIRSHHNHWHDKARRV